MDSQHLHILWTNADVVTGRLMVMMYARNSMKNRWWEQVTVILWGGTTKLMAENADMQEEMARAREFGVEFVGCITCAEELGVTEQLQALGVTLTKWGPPLSDLLHSGSPLLSI